MRTLAQVVLQTRNRLGWSQQTTADKSGVSQATVQFIERRPDYQPTPGTLMRLATAFIETTAFDEMEMRALLQEMDVPFTALKPVIGRVLAAQRSPTPLPAADPDEHLISMLRRAIKMNGHARMQAILAGLLVPTPLPIPPAPEPKTTKPAQPQARARRAG